MIKAFDVRYECPSEIVFRKRLVQKLYDEVKEKFKNF